MFTKYAQWRAANVYRVPVSGDLKPLDLKTAVGRHTFDQKSFRIVWTKKRQKKKWAARRKRVVPAKKTTFAVFSPNNESRWQRLRTKIVKKKNNTLFSLGTTGRVKVLIRRSRSDCEQIRIFAQREDVFSLSLFVCLVFIVTPPFHVVRALCILFVPVTNWFYPHLTNSSSIRLYTFST